MHSLRFTIVLPFILGSILLVVFLAFYTYNVSYYSMEDSVHLIAEERARNTNMTMNWIFRTLTVYTENLATEPQVLALFHNDDNKTKLSDELNTLFDILTQGNEHYNSIVIVDKNGVGIASNSQMKIGVSFADREYIKSALKGYRAYGDISVGRISKDLNMTVAVPIFINSEIVGAVVIVNNFPSIIKNSTERAGVKAIFSKFILPDGKIITSGKSAINVENVHYKETYDELAKNVEGGTVNYFLDGKEYIGYAIVESNTKWIIVSSGEQKALLTDVFESITIILWISIMVLGIITYVVVLRIDRILNVLFSLIRYAKKISEGKLRAKLKDYSGNDELSTLHSALKTMVNSIGAMVIKSQEASSMKSEFIANMSHEIRTPLNAVIGLSYLYLNGNNPQANKNDYVVKIHIAARSLLGIINNILDISKIEAGMFELDNVAFNLKDVGEQIITIHKDNSVEKNIDLRFEYDEGLPTHFIGDSTRLGQILNNLVGNALKFTEKGFVCVRFSLGSAEEGVDSLQFVPLAISVSDSGLGIPPDKLSDLFKAFTQVDTSITRRFGGTGLGLTISEWLVNAMKGKLKVESELGKGTTFFFVINLERFIDISNANLEEEKVEQLCLKGKRILVAEDNEINQLIVEELLLLSEANVHMVENGLLAVNAVKEQTFDIVLMDMQMPVMGGLKASQEIRKLFSMEELPIIAVTANAMKEDKVISVEAGINDYLTKPIEPTQFIETLRRWLVDKK